MFAGGCNSSPAFASLLKKLCDAFMAPVPGHLDETAIVIAIPLRVGACFQKDLHRREMPCANREVNRLGIPVFRLAQARIALEQPPKRRRVAGRGGSDRVPDVASLVRFQFAWLDHSEPRFGA